MARLPESTLARIRRWCEEQSPVEYRDQLYVDFDVRGSSVTIVECRPPWDGVGEWTRQKVAQLRNDATDETWSLYWADSNSRWHPYDPLLVAGNLDRLLIEINRDPTCIFWG